jgi:hypothetical protein
VVPHVAARETHQRSLKFSFFTRKRLFQHYRHEASLVASSCDVRYADATTFLAVFQSMIDVALKRRVN